MHHVKQAMDIYNQYDLYKVRKIQCHFVISGNYVDFKHFEKSLPHLEKAGELSKQLDRNERLLSSAYYNLGKNYADLGINDKADHLLNEVAKNIRKC
ncbi:hypothetical protein HS9_01283 [Bacillus velezensis]|nr:hypothetical protein [Bacillus velezensis]RAP07220.1 hypothetical protein HS9_01283 [Bacillus velezensis]